MSAPRARGRGCAAGTGAWGGNGDGLQCRAHVQAGRRASERHDHADVRLREQHFGQRERRVREAPARTSRQPAERRVLQPAAVPGRQLPGQLDRRERGGHGQGVSGAARPDHARQQRRRLQPAADRHRAGACRHRRRGGGRALEDLPSVAGVHPARSRRLRARIDLRGPAPRLGRHPDPDHEGRADLQRPGEQGPVHADADLVRAGHVPDPRELVGGHDDVLPADVRHDADRVREPGLPPDARRAPWARRG